MNSTFTKCVSQALSWATVVILSCTTVFAQIPNQTSAQAQTVPTRNESQLPEGPVPSSVSSSAQPLGGVHPQSSSAASPISFSSDPKSQVTVLENTLIRVMTNQPLSSRLTRQGTPLLFTLSEDVDVDNVLIIPRGEIVHGTVVQSRKAGTLTGSPDLILKLVSLDLGGRNYPLYTYQFKVEGASKSQPTETKVKGGVLIGALVGGMFSGSAKGEPTAVGKLAGMGTGAALGVGVATVVAAASPGSIVSIPTESQIDFYLASPISVFPVSVKEATHLAEGLRSGGPVLYVRGDTP